MEISTIKQYADEKQENLYKNFPTTHFLSNPKNVHNVFLWATFFRRNLHRFVLDYLNIKLHLYQVIILYLMGICNFVVIIASRAAAKSFIIAIYSCCRCILYPGSQVVLASGTKGQAKLIVTQKIETELMNISPQLRREIDRIYKSGNETIVKFHNGATIIVVTANENGRGNRSTACVREEFRQIAKKIDDNILSPFQIIRSRPYMLIEPYNKMPELKEEPVNIYISSSWYDNGHWMWKIVDDNFKGMLEGEPKCLLAFDESVTLMHNIRTFEQLRTEKKKIDNISWRIEYLNERVKDNTDAFFTYDMIMKNQRSKKPFYPRLIDDVRCKKKNPHEIPKQDGEIRIVACDMAFVQDKKNDNSVFSCIRALPESSIFSNNSVEVKMGYKRVVPYIESIQGGDTSKQALRIRQLYEDFSADYIVLDLRNAGISIFDMLAKVMYDEERDCEYSPLTCMNDENLVNRIKNPNAKPVIFAITASQKLNSDIAFCMRNTLSNKMIDFLINYNDAKEDVLSNIKEYMISNDIEIQLFYEKPFLETQMFVSESANLQYERMEQTGLIKVSEVGANRKDRYTSVSYGNYFISLREQELLSETNDEDLSKYKACVSSIEF